MKGFSKHHKILFAGLILMALIFLLEVNTESLIGTVAYIFVVIYTLWFLGTRKQLLVIGATSSFFIILAFLILYEKGGNYPVIITNRILSLAVVWLAIHFTARFNRLYDEQARKTVQLNALFENANEGMLFLNEEGKITLANPYLENMFGYGKQDLINKDLSVLIPEKSKDNHAKHYENFLKKPVDRHRRKEFLGRRSDGKEFPVEISLSHFHHKNKLCIIAFILNASEKKEHQLLIEGNLARMKNYNLALEKEVKQRTLELEQSNAELKKSQSLYQAMAHHFPGGIIGVLDKNMKYLIVDGKDLKSFEASESTPAGIVTFDDIHSMISHYAETLKKVFEGESISFDTDINGKFYNISSVPIPGVEEEVSNILFVAKNITKHRNLEKHLLNNLQNEKELNILKSRFVTMASHEFRSPLTTILTSSFLLEHYTGTKLEQERKKHLDRIRRAVHGMTELLNDFLSIAKLEEGKVKVLLDVLDLPSFFEEFLQEITLLKKDGQEIEFKWEGNLNRFRTDKQLLKNILMNLISNAIKYSPPSGNIELSVVEEHHQICIQVRDYGIGIPEEEQKHIYKRFFRAHNAAQIQGTGLGLNLIRKYVKLLKGNIAFTSSENQGTTFKVYLPILSPQLKTSTTFIK